MKSSFFSFFDPVIKYSESLLVQNVAPCKLLPDAIDLHKFIGIIWSIVLTGKLSDVKKRPEINQPSLYLLINSSENQIYIGESENFYHRIRNHDQSKAFSTSIRYK